MRGSRQARPSPAAKTAGPSRHFRQSPLYENMLPNVVLCMRTMIDVNDGLLRAAKAHAAGRRRTLKATIEQALREFLAGP